MLFLPGPGILTIAAGLALLAKDIPLADRLATRVRQKVGLEHGPIDLDRETEPSN